MALYKVTRTDEVQPGEFVSAHVIAGGVGQAREAVRHMEGVTRKNVRAEKVSLTASIRVLDAYYDERDPETSDSSPVAYASVNYLLQGANDTTSREYVTLDDLHAASFLN